MATPEVGVDDGAPRSDDGRWTIVLGSTLGSTVGIFTTVIVPFSIVTGPLRRELGWTSTDVALALTSCYIGFSSTAYWGASVLDRTSTRKLMIGAYLVLGALLAALAGLPANRFAIYGVYALIGAAGVATSVVAHSRIVTGWFTRRRGLALGSVNAGAAVGAFAIPQVVHACLPGLGWRGTFAVLGALTAGIGATSAAVLSADPPRRGPRGAASSLAASVDRGWLWSLLAMFSAFGLVTSACISQLAPMLAEHGLSAARAAFGVALFGLSGIFGRLAVGRLLDAFAPRGVMVGCAATAAAFAVFLALGPPGDAALLGPVLLGLAYGAELDLLPFVVARRHGVADYAAVFGRLFAAFTIASALGPPLLAAAFDATGSYRGALVGCAIVFAVVGLASLRFIDRRASAR